MDLKFIQNSSQSNFVVTCSSDRFVKIWNIESCTLISEFKDEPSRSLISKIAISYSNDNQEENMIFLASKDNQVRAW